MLAVRKTHRAGYTLMELIIVMAILLVLGAMLAPTFTSTTRDTRVKAGADLVRGRMEEARANAIEDARPYCVSLSTDGLRIRVSPAGFEDGMIEPVNEEENPPFIAQDEFPQGVSAVPILDEMTPAAGNDQWVRVATFLPDGTCKEDHAIIEIREPGVHSMVVTLRGLTGSVSVKAGKAGVDR